MFGNNRREFLILLPKHLTKCKSDQMSLSLPKKWIVVVAIPSYSSVDCPCFLRELSPILGAMLPLASTP